ncbi:hypothetical protein Cgig2_024778 [Carnegiea gigantea]|uniref:Uncharacterized protein n=1 Tax=Carnegiea gigantea TaxID=171969 RepID=A0A9Q1QCH6_9CARY|nr:hypothetical protein Cgig2_024778 [Carnegiea gigantea]
MAASSYPTRSISLPSRLLPNSNAIERSVNRLKSWDLSLASTSGSQGAESIQLGLVGLVELYGNVHDLILSPFAQQALLRHDQGRLIGEVMDGSLGLLDTCSTARDLILRLQEQVRDLRSALRRKGCLSVKTELSVYMGFRKKMAKDVAKCLRMLKQAEDKHGLAAPSLGLSPYVSMVVKVLREVYVATVKVFRSLFLYLSMPGKAGGWSFISRLVSNRPGARPIKSEEIFNEVTEVDLALHDLDDAKVDLQLVGGRLQALDASVGILEVERTANFLCLYSVY